MLFISTGVLHCHTTQGETRAGDNDDNVGKMILIKANEKHHGTI